ncbi:hypothetical protein L6164_009520 [Bauhinia variegata]|uniref:Uncharacterized protein n=1 Tax=Bauhinia variegata TaxID=167791 RepID=A0ACB9PJB9_BAUVA|nr:hypothetical protein L6164_009520 [Bauhinia variegata]
MYFDKFVYEGIPANCNNESLSIVSYRSRSSIPWIVNSSLLLDGRSLTFLNLFFELSNVSVEVLDMEGKNTESHMVSTTAFVEGGIQETSGDACSICLEDFGESNPSTVTTCKHEFHLQCLLEWCQRSSKCPLCWRSMSLKDPSSQELLEAVERERTLRNTPSRNAATFRHSALGDFELQRLPDGVNHVDFEERIIQHLAAAAAAMSRTQHLGWREGQRARPSSGHGRPQFLVFSTRPSVPTSGPVSPAGGGTEPAAIPVGSPSTPLTSDRDEPSQQIAHLQTRSASLPSRYALMGTNHQQVYSDDRGSTVHSSPPNQDKAVQTFSESLRSRLNSASMRYKESISKSTRGWKERLFSRNSSMSDLGSEVRRELNAGIASFGGSFFCGEKQPRLKVHYFSRVQP